MVIYTGVANAPTGVTFIASGAIPGVVSMGWFDATGNTPMNISAGKLLDINFTYKGGYCAVGFITSACDIANASGISLTGVGYQNGSLL